MADIYPVTDDNLSEAELVNYIDFSNLTNYFEDDCAYTPDHTNEEVTVNSGKAYVRDTNGDTYVLEPDQETKSFPNQSGNNFLYLTFDPTASDPEGSVSWEISDTDGGPADPKLKRAEIDASADTDTSFNDNPDATHETTTTESLVIGGTLYKEDPNSPIDVSSTSSTTFTTTNDPEGIVIIPDPSAAGFDELQANGDTGANYDTVDNSDTTSTGNSQWSIPRQQDAAYYQLWDKDNSVRLSVQIGTASTGLTVAGENNNLGGSGITQFTLKDSGASNRSAKARVYELDLGV